MNIIAEEIFIFMPWLLKLPSNLLLPNSRPVGGAGSKGSSIGGSGSNGAGASGSGSNGAGAGASGSSGAGGSGAGVSGGRAGGAASCISSFNSTKRYFATVPS